MLTITHDYHILDNLEVHNAIQSVRTKLPHEATCRECIVRFVQCKATEVIVENKIRAKVLVNQYPIDIKIKVVQKQIEVLSSN